MISLVTDSASQIPPELVERLEVTVIPVRIAVDGIEYLEGIDLDADEMWELLARQGDTTPTVKTSQPPPGDFVDVYESLAEAGCHRHRFGARRRGLLGHAKQRPVLPSRFSNREAFE